VLKLWTIRRATGIGVVAGLLSLVLWPLYAAYQETMFWPFVAALTVTAFCGLSILAITGVDMLLHRRGESVRPIRAFDIVVGLALAASSLIQIEGLLPL
jgi:drug/metabolite transporter (DMT)-like permease